ncbi:FecR family protein [Prolixibacter denitrificans]|uniref:Anti-sigma factor n=1 Tax=Prolixibacter denitrificans TaxID=1541063 RepID=A0A2P8C8I4_9BACT|nr:FecR domain-containing protein [Prolixibacter denitrificans]PSK81268.1 ferric-dicitrate binding protein FerR (iron transport regulator) [Prolixibacter denitrificans]GET21648.1 anti-sigma factor [Prolixibacter denitrificans]
MSTTDFYELAIRCLTNEGTDHDWKELEKFLQKREYRQLYQKLASSFPSEEKNSPQYNLERSLNRLRSGISLDEKRVPTRKKGRIKVLLRGLVAASVAAVIALGTVKYHSGKEDIQSKSEKVAWLKKSAPAGQQVRVLLSDGTQVILNGNSQLRYASNYASQSVRKVFLSGEAFFTVKHNDKKEFEVVTGHVVTRDLGTRFNVEAYAEDSIITVALVDGAIEVSSPVARHLQLKPHQKLTYHASDNSQEVNSFNVAELTGWKDQLLIFHNKPLPVVLEKLSRHYGKPIVFHDSALNQIVLTTQFKQKSLDQVLEVLSYAVGVKFIDKGDSILAVKNNSDRKRNEN